MPKPNNPKHDEDLDLDVIEQEPELKEPARYQVILLNDDYTPMDFVVFILTDYFNLSVDKATQIMMHVHTKGEGVCGVYSKEIAETKAMEVNETARANKHPLKCIYKEA